MLSETAKHVAHCMKTAIEKGASTVEVSEKAEAEWVETILRLADGRMEFAEQCTPGYYNNEGKPGKQTRQNFFYFGGPTEFVEILEAWRAEGGMSGLELG